MSDFNLILDAHMVITGGFNAMPNFEVITRSGMMSAVTVLTIEKIINWFVSIRLNYDVHLTIWRWLNKQSKATTRPYIVAYSSAVKSTSPHVYKALTCSTRSISGQCASPYFSRWFKLQPTRRIWSVLCSYEYYPERSIAVTSADPP